MVIAGVESVVQPPDGGALRDNVGAIVSRVLNVELNAIVWVFPERSRAPFTTTDRFALIGSGAAGTKTAWFGALRVAVPGSTTAPWLSLTRFSRSVVAASGSENVTVTVALGSFWMLRLAGAMAATAGGERS